MNNCFPSRKVSTSLKIPKAKGFLGGIQIVIFVLKINKERSHAPLSYSLSSISEKPHCLLRAQIAPAITIRSN
jgi:hypothetical protein